MPTQASHKKINQEKDFEEFKKFIDEFKSETDRAAVILGAAKLDNYLYQILSNFLLPTPSGNDELLDGEGPLGTFSSRINISYRLGLIDHEFSKTLHHIRRIRNSFAHEISGANLNTGTYTDKIRVLTGFLKHYKEYAGLQAAFFNSDKSPSTDFKTVLVIAMIRLSVLLDSHSKCLTINEAPIGMIPKKWINRKTIKFKK